MATATVTAVALGTGASAQAASAARVPGCAAAGLYIVQMIGDPLSSYSGNVKCYAPTKPAKGHKLAAHPSTAKAYGSLLRTPQDATLSRAGVSGASVVYHYSTTFNGVAVRLTADQLNTLQKSSSVIRVFKNRILTRQTPTTPKFLGLTGKAGVWAKQFASDNNAARASSSVTSTPASGPRARASRRSPRRVRTTPSSRPSGPARATRASTTR